ncbi:MAG: radical SAM protein [Planctomycetes bacterium]|nr:radical SAM protein [Planctomycetota bacterium]
MAEGTRSDLSSVHLTLHLTTACNMRCSYCYAPPHDGAPMSEEIGRKAMRLGSQLSGGSSCGIVFFGGEPLLRQDLIESLIEHGRDLERRQAGCFHFKITTNGVLLDDSFLEFSIRNDLLIAMSFDGVREAHDKHRHMADGRPSFDLLVERLRLLLEARPYASVLMVVNPDTAEHLSDSVSFLLDLGCRYVILSLNYAAAWGESDFRVLRRQYEKLGKAYVKWMLAGRKFYLSPIEVKLSSHINQHCFHKERCELAQRQLSVDPQGYLYPCVQFPRAGPGSSWCVGHVDAGINEEARRRLHDASEEEKPSCAGCAVKSRCNNTCGCLNWQTTGAINEVSPVLCRYEQMLMSIADNIGRTLYQARNPLFLHKHYNAGYPVLSLLDDVLEK